jgi:hypothetical protein
MDPIRFTPEYALEWIPTNTSIPVQPRLTIKGDAWIPILPFIQAPKSPYIPATFKNFIDTLDFWETELFLQLTMEVDCYTFLELVNEQPAADIQLLTMSDGSDDAGAMTFGWILSLPNGRRLARCSGLAYGPYGSSFRAKGYGFLSVLHFLVRIQEFCDQQPTWRIQMMTDNQGLLTRVETSLPFVDPFPNCTLQANWDVTNKIITSLRQLSKTPTFLHVKGHQDDGAAHDTLPLNAQLNVDADEEAGIYQHTFPSQRPIVPRLPSNRAQLHIAGKVVPSNLKKRIREAFTLLTYLLYLQERFTWSNQCIATVDWNAYTRRQLVALAPGVFRPQNSVMIFFPRPDGFTDTTSSQQITVSTVVRQKTVIISSDVHLQQGACGATIYLFTSVKLTHLMNMTLDC